MSFIFGGNTGRSYDELLKERQRLDAIQKNTQNTSDPLQNMGLALGRVGVAYFQGENSDAISDSEVKNQQNLESDLQTISTPMIAQKMRNNMQGPVRPQYVLDQQKDEALARASNNPMLSKNPIMQSIIAKHMSSKLAAGLPLTPQQKLEMAKSQSVIDKNNASVKNMGQTEAMKEYAFAKSQGFSGSFNDFVQIAGRRGTTNINLGKDDPNILGVGSIPSGKLLVRDPETGEPMIKSIKGNESFNEGDQKTIGFLNRANTANDTLSVGSNENILTGFYENKASGVPIVGNYLTSDEYKVAHAAGQEFLTAILRKDTGAAISDQEIAIYGKMYLPQIGDETDVLKYKRDARSRALDGLKKGLTPDAIRRLEEETAAEMRDKSNQEYMQQGNNMVYGNQSPQASQDDPMRAALNAKFRNK